MVCENIYFPAVTEGATRKLWNRALSKFLVRATWEENIFKSSICEGLKVGPITETTGWSTTILHTCDIESRNLYHMARPYYKTNFRVSGTIPVTYTIFNINTTYVQRFM